MGNQIKKLETTTKTMNLVSKLALGSAIALKGVESSQLPLEESFRHLQDKKGKSSDQDDFIAPRFGKKPRYVAKCRVHDKDDEFAARFALRDQEVMFGTDEISEYYEIEQQTVPGVAMDAFVAGKMTDFKALIWVRGISGTWARLGEHSMTEKGNFTARNVAVPLLDLERMYNHDGDF